MNIGSTTIKSLKYETIKFMYTNRGGSVMEFMIALSMRPHDDYYDCDVRQCLIDLLHHHDTQ